MGGCFWKDFLEHYPLTWFVLELTGSAALTGLAAAVQLLPLLLAGLFGGPLIDRLGFRRSAILSDLLSGLTIALIPLLHAFGLLSYPLLVALMFLAALFETPGGAARESLATELAERAGWPCARTSGPCLPARPEAGVRLPLPQPGAAASRRRVLRLEPAAATDLHRGAACPGAGDVRRPRAAGRSDLRLRRRHRAGRGHLWDAGPTAPQGHHVAGRSDAAGGGAVAAGPVLVLGALLALLGFGMGPLGPIVATTLGERTPPELRGRVFALFGALVNAGIPVGVGLGGLAMQGVGAGVTFAVIAALFTLLTLFAWRTPGVRAALTPGGSLTRSSHTSSVK